MVGAMDTRSGDLVIRDLDIRCSFRGRLRGFMFSRRPENGSAILLMNTGRIHTAWMRFSLDLYFFDASLRLLGLTRAVEPFRLPASPRGCRHILEVPHTPGRAPLEMALGDRLSIVITCHCALPSVATGSRHTGHGFRRRSSSYGVTSAMTALVIASR